MDNVRLIFLSTVAAGILIFTVGAYFLFSTFGADNGFTILLVLFVYYFPVSTLPLVWSQQKAGMLTLNPNAKFLLFITYFAIGMFTTSLGLELLVLPNSGSALLFTIVLGFFLFASGLLARVYTQKLVSLSQQSVGKEPVFSASGTTSVILALFCGMLWLFGLIYAVFQALFHTPSSSSELFTVIADAAFVGVLSTASFYYAFREITSPVRTIKVYNEYLLIVGWKTRIKARYSDIANMELVLTNRFWRISWIKLNVAGQSVPFKIRNLKLRRLRTDLYSWLTEKLKQARASQRPADVQ